ncbi:hypothetical protein O6H91_09G007000 [Diphasiastrum complanatum]|uniref:Uncharacterized protein n=3 Tax=Diphasiastrum complanatum TaxID=34168 RepID=A0ACC2CL15_DIPCM|nr:hypothetical protein O6H91_09G007000 [Diphasiastrum complanatum]KAJ7542695.1 hypothetical protein O6H91_09G007000 [Diphasiastrum complanatum]KAJ7542696.1 hypothetical protein O6H91_09G007000 [Diphasiastrum complanatum]
MAQKKNRIRLSKLYSYACSRPSVAEGNVPVPVTGPGFSRVVYCNQPSLHKAKPFKYRSNYVSTTKYNVVTFFPKALFEQFRRVANLYFLFAAALSLTPLAPFTAASLIAPLVFVVGLSMTKEAIEDWRRFLQDEEVNKRKVKVHVGGGKFELTQWQKLQVGDVVLVEKDNFFPADLLLLSSSYPDGICYVETMNLDGETNLKLKKSPERTVELDEDSEFGNFRGIIKCEDPNADLYTFVGNLEYNEDVIPLGPQQILLRDSKLRNTTFVYGVVIFSGHDTKVMQNSTEPPSKRSSIERKMDYIIYLLFSVLLLIGTVGSIVFGLKTKYDMPKWWYMRPDDTTIFFNPKKSVVAALLHLVTALILYGYLIPISLYVSIEIVKVLQAMFINQDLEMYYPETDTPARARTSNLNEELGMVDTILSDKTGTLTCNMMEFIKCSIAGTPYGKGVTEVEKATAKRLGKGSPDTDAAVESENINGEDSGIEMTSKPHVKGFNFQDDRIMNGNWIHEPHSDDIRMFLRILAICQTAIPEEDASTGTISYEAESPDEASFVVAARELGFEFYKRTQSSVLLREFDPTTLKRVQREYKILNLLEFNSTRKRMSVVVQDESGQIFLFCKGADSVIFERLKNNGRKYEDSTKKHLATYGDAGLRTLALAYRKLDEAEYTEWNAIFVKAKTTVGANREELLDEASEKIEKDLILVGATAVEDKLQKGVPECIDHLAQAGLKIWVLTGDKMETAINIGFACSLLRQGMQQIIISLENSSEAKAAEQSQDKEMLTKVSMESITQQISNGQQKIISESNEDSAFALIIDGKALSYALKDSLKDELLRLATSCASVICCRVSPKQKALVTQLVRKGTGKTTLAIGDGANDVGMIQEADIGVGISGVEGMQAVMASDFAIAQFRFLERLLIVHGHWCYKRISIMICYFFYKNITFGLTLFYFEAYTSFSGQSAYNDWYMSLFNVFFSSLPVLALGVFEKDVPARVCLEFPTLYQQGTKNMFFNWPYILAWMFNGLCSSAITYFFAINIYQHQAFRKGGQTVGLEELGAAMYTCVVWTVNLQIALIISYFTWIQHLFIWGSIGLWYLFLVVYGSIKPDLSTTAYKVLVEALAPTPSYWILVLVIVIACLLPYFVVTAIHNSFWPKDHHILQEMMHLQKHTRDPEMWSREGSKARHKTAIGCSARVEDKIRQLKMHARHNR